MFCAAPGMASILALIFFVWVGFATRRMCLLRKDIVKHESATSVMFQHSIPRDSFVRAVISLQVLFLFVMPLAYLTIENRPIALMFAFSGLFSALRHYINPCILLAQNAKKDYFRNVIHAKTRDERKEWKKKSRLYHLVAVGGDTARQFWTGAYILCVVFFLGMVLLATNEQPSQSAAPQSSMTLVKGYAYQPNPHLPYPTCRVKFGGNHFELAVSLECLHCLSVLTNSLKASW